MCHFLLRHELALIITHSQCRKVGPEEPIPHVRPGRTTTGKPTPARPRRARLPTSPATQHGRRAHRHPHVWPKRAQPLLLRRLRPQRRLAPSRLAQRHDRPLPNHAPRSLARRVQRPGMGPASTTILIALGAHLGRSAAPRNGRRPARRPKPVPPSDGVDDIWGAAQDGRRAATDHYLKRGGRGALMRPRGVCTAPPVHTEGLRAYLGV